jgi:ribosomal protein S18 acetylase RimI-like enzyme
MSDRPGATAHLRSAVPEDEEALRLIDQQTWTAAVSPAAAPGPGTAFFDDRTAPQDVLVAEIDGTVAGYVALRRPTHLPSHAHVLEVAGLAVSPLHQRLGVGEVLVRGVIDEAAARGARKLSLRVLAPNAGARRLYERCGFVLEGVLRGEFLLDGEYVDDVLMARHLTESGSEVRPHSPPPP